MMESSLAAPWMLARIGSALSSTTPELFTLGAGAPGTWGAVPGRRFRIPLDESFFRGVTYNQMVVDQLSESDMDRVFQAFADATRRDIVRRVTLAEYTVSGLAAYYAMSFAAVQKHVAVLERASLITKEKRGREQVVRANHSGLHKAQRLLDQYEAIWRQRSARIANILAEEAPDEPQGKAIQ